MDKELEAMSAVAGALTPLGDDERSRVLRWAVDRFSDGGSVQLGSGLRAELEVTPPALETRQFSDVSDLVDISGAKSGPELALAVGYWLQVVEGRESWASVEVNDHLKNLGRGLVNVTATLGSLSARKPALVMQVAKAGRARQGRKAYKLTAAGVKAVEQDLDRNRQED